VQADTINKLGRPVAISAQRISDWKSGRNIPANFEALQPVLLVLSERARKRRTPLRSHQLLDIQAWRKLWLQAQNETTQNKTTDSAGVRTRSVPGRTGDPSATGDTDATTRLLELVRRTPARSAQLEALIIRGQTAVDAALWAVASRDPVLLYGGSRLASALRHIDISCDSGSELDDATVIEFLRASSHAFGGRLVDQILPPVLEMAHDDDLGPRTRPRHSGGVGV
jgi:hypothetical protein